MSEVRPFRAIRYNSGKIGDMWPVLSPPWDKITPELGEQLRAAHPNNVAHLVVPSVGSEQLRVGAPAPQGETKGSEWPACVRVKVAEWLDEGILEQEEKSGFYVYRMHFLYNGVAHVRPGFLALSRLGPPEVSGVLPHEQIFPDHYQTRLELIRETETNFGPIFMIYSDPRGETITLLGEPDETRVVRATDPDTGIMHEIWPVDDADVCRTLSEVMNKKELFIADGHHRFGAAQAYAEEWHANHPDAPAVTPEDFRMCYLTPMECEGLQILPTHRVFPGLAERLPEITDDCMTKFFECLSDSFQNEADLLDAMCELRTREPEKKVLGLYDGNRFVLLQWTGAEPASYSGVHVQRTATWKSLDVNVLHEIFLPEVLNWDRGTDSHWVSHHREAGSAVRAVKSSPGSLAVFLNRTSCFEVQAIAQAGEKMPQKSTDFYPKIPTGLAFRKIEGAFGV